MKSKGYRTFQTKDFGLKVANGNTGIGDVWCISKDVSTCGPLSAYCKPFCYMGSAFYRSMTNIAKAHQHNGEIFRRVDAANEWEDFGNDLAEFLLRKDAKLFRINVNGDMISGAELDFWMELAGSMPDTQFLAFTKQIHLLDSFVVNEVWDIQNFSLYVSVFFNYPVSLLEKVFSIGLPIAYTDNVNRYEYRQCKKPCSKCQWCFNEQKDVYLPIHGSEAVKKCRELKEVMEGYPE